MSQKLDCVIVAVDGSEESMNALKWALDNLKCKSSASDLEVPAFTAAIEAHQKRITQAIFDHALQICSGKNVNVKTEVFIGDPKEKICEAVEHLNSDLLVMGNRAFGPIKRMFLGSVSNYCSNHAQCPVLIIKSHS